MTLFLALFMSKMGLEHRLILLSVLLLACSLVLSPLLFGIGIGSNGVTTGYVVEGQQVVIEDMGTKVSDTNTAVSPRIHGDNIVWLDVGNTGDDKEKELFLSNTNSFNTMKVTDNTIKRSNLDINSDGAVFVEDGLGITLFDPDDNSFEDVPVELEPFPNEPPTIKRCNIGGGAISFIATENNDMTDVVNRDPDCFVYFLGNGSTVRYSDLAPPRRHGGQWDAVTDGEYMVFSNNGTSHISEVASADLETGDVHYIRLEDGGLFMTLFGPYDMDDGLAVFEDDATEDIAYFNAGTRKFHTIAHPGIDKDPSIQGGKIVWKTLHDTGAGDQYDIFVYDISKDSIAQVTNSQYNELDPDIHGNDVVFSSNREGDWGVYHRDITNLHFNSPPTIDSISSSADTLPPGGSCTITAEGSDPDSDPLTYIWDVTGGAIEGEGSTITWQAPDTEDDHTIFCTASDGTSNSDIAQVTILVRSDPLTGSPPTIERIDISPAGVEPGGTVEVNVIASDVDGDDLLFEFTANGGEFDSSGELTPATGDIWTAPDGEGSYVITVRAYDGTYYSEAKLATVSVSSDPSPPTNGNRPPEILNAHASPETSLNDGRSEVLLIIQLTDPDGLDDIQAVETHLGEIEGRSPVYPEDDGRGEDTRSDDGEFTYALILPKGTPPGAYELQVVVTDSWGSTDTGVLSLVVEEGPDLPQTEKTDDEGLPTSLVIGVSLVVIVIVAILVVVAVAIGGRMGRQ